MKKTKNIVLLISFIFTVFFFSMLFKSDVINNYCYLNGHCGFLVGILNSFILTFLSYISIFIFPFSLATYFFKDKIFRSWIIFTCIWIPLSFLLIMLAPNTGANGTLLSITIRGGVLILADALFVLISLIIIIVQVIKVYFVKNK